MEDYLQESVGDGPGAKPLFEILLPKAIKTMDPGNTWPDLYINLYDKPTLICQDRFFLSEDPGKIVSRGRELSDHCQRKSPEDLAGAIVNEFNASRCLRKHLPTGMMAVPTRGDALHTIIPEQYHHLVDRKKDYHITLDFDPKNLFCEIVQVRAVGIVQHENFVWLDVEMKYTDSSEWIKHQADGRRLHITLKSPPGRAGEIGRMTQSGYPFRGTPKSFLAVPLVKKNMDQGLDSNHLQLFFDLDQTLIWEPKEGIPEDLKKNFGFLRSPDVLSSSRPTQLLKVAANSVRRLEVVTSRKVPSELCEPMKWAFRDMLVDNFLSFSEFNISFRQEKIQGDGYLRELKKGEEKAKRIGQLADPTGAEPIMFDDSEGTIEGLTGAGICSVLYQNDQLQFVPGDQKPVVGIQAMPGLGKSTVLEIVRLKIPGSVIFSTDQLHMEGFTGGSAYPELERRIRKAKQDPKVTLILVDTGFSSGGCRNRKRRPSWLTYLVGFNVRGLECLVFYHATQGILNRTGHPLQVRSLKTAEQLPDQKTLKQLADQFTSSGNFQELQAMESWFSQQFHSVKIVEPHFEIPGSESLNRPGKILLGTIITIEYIGNAKNMVTDWGREARGVSYIWTGKEFECFKATFPIGPEVGPNSEDNGRPQAPIYDRIKEDIRDGKPVPSVVTLKVDGECFALTCHSLKTNIGYLLGLWTQHSPCEFTRRLGTIDPDHCFSLSSRGTPGLGFCKNNNLAHDKLWAHFISSVCGNMALETKSLTLEKGFEMTMNYLRTRIVDMLKQIACSTGLTCVMECFQGGRRCQFQDLVLPVQAMLAVSYPSPGCLVIGFNQHTGLRGFSSVQGRADTMDRYSIPYVGYIQTEHPGKIIHQLNQILQADPDQFQIELAKFNLLFRGDSRFFHPEGLVAVIGGVYVKLKTETYYPCHAKGATIDTVKDFPPHLAKYFPIINLSVAIGKINFEEICQDLQLGINTVVLSLSSDPTHRHQKMVQKILGNKGVSEAFLALVNQPDISKHPEIHPLLMFVIAHSHQLWSNILRKLEAGQEDLLPAVYRLVRTLGTLDQSLDYKKLMEMAKHPKAKNIPNDITVIFG